MVGLGDSSLQADLQLTLVDLVWGSAATWMFYIYQVNWVNSRTDLSWWQHYKYCLDYYYYYYFFTIIIIYNDAVFTFVKKVSFYT